MRVYYIRDATSEILDAWKVFHHPPYSYEPDDPTKRQAETQLLHSQRQLLDPVEYTFKFPV
jgi:hypothetical protein